MSQHPASWQSLDWAILDRLRETFLASRPGGAPYWRSEKDVAHYDLTYAQRIGWKWDAVLSELVGRSWVPPSGPVVDWGCGSGIASRRVLAHFGPAAMGELCLVDHSEFARDFARARAATLYPTKQIVTRASDQLHVSELGGTLVVSHVLNELDEAGGQLLRRAIDRADAVLWVEPGTYADSRTLVAMREELRGRFTVLAPCTHQNPCGLLAVSNERHWCHHFAPPPAGIMGNGNWVRFAQRAGIDLRSVPYSYLVLDRREQPAAPVASVDTKWSRVLGAPRIYKGFAKILRCREEGVGEVEMQKRESPEQYRAFKNGEGTNLFQWREDGGRVREIKGWTPKSSPIVETTSLETGLPAEDPTSKGPI